MKTISNPYQETIVELTTPSQLRVMIVHKPEFVNQAVIIGTPFGGLTTTVQTDQGIEHLKPGLAHFLEHQLFEGEMGNIMGEFTSYGANVNAFTSHHETAYYFSTTNNLKHPLNLLLDLISQVSITEESTSKEKGIIIQELNMYDQMPEAVLIKETFKTLYQTHPLIHDIGGTIESVSQTTKDDLLRAYELFYHPSNMHMVIITHHQVEDVVSWLADHSFTQQTRNKLVVSDLRKRETHTHLPKTTSISMDVNQNKVTVSLAITPNAHEKIELLKQQWALKILLEMHFSEINPHYQQWMDDQRINELFDYDVDIKSDYGHVLFLFEHINTTDAATFITEQMPLITPTQETLEQLKRRYFFSNLRVFNRPTSMMTQLLHYKLDDLSYFDVLDVIQSLTLDDLIEAKSALVDQPLAIVEVKSDKI
jgi:predicted Zn-dependent peptidase